MEQKSPCSFQISCESEIFYKCITTFWDQGNSKQPIEVNFVFSKKPQNLTKSSPSIWHLLHTVKSTVKISSIIVAFLENTNFTLKPKNSKLITYTVRGGFFTFWAILAHSAAVLSRMPAHRLMYLVLSHAKIHKNSNTGQPTQKVKFSITKGK